MEKNFSTDSDLMPIENMIRHLSKGYFLDFSEYHASTSETEHPGGFDSHDTKKRKSGKRKK